MSKVQWANGLKLVLQLDVPFLSYVVSFRETVTNVVQAMVMSAPHNIARQDTYNTISSSKFVSGQGDPRIDGSMAS